ncbi:2-deoxyribose-5-phosphate aldolase, partial [Halobacteriales archaeon QH_10_67_13]
GIATASQAEALLEAGADLLGASSGVEIVAGERGDGY